ncbi:TPA: LPXTG cell wall anchor domain-containing protein, partial [Streptococcus suis]
IGPQGPQSVKGDTGPVGPQGIKDDVGATSPVEVAKPKEDSVTTSDTGATTPPIEEELITAKGESLLQPALPEFEGGIVPNVAPTAEALPIGVLPESEEEIITAKGESLLQPTLPEFEDGIVPNVAPTAEALPIGVLPESEEEIITAKGESVKAPALPALDLSAIKASHAPAVVAASAKKETLPETGVSESLALTALGLLGLAVAGKLAQRKRY